MDGYRAQHPTLVPNRDLKQIGRPGGGSSAPTAGSPRASLDRHTMSLADSDGLATALWTRTRGKPSTTWRRQGIAERERPSPTHTLDKQSNPSLGGIPTLFPSSQNYRGITDRARYKIYTQKRQPIFSHWRGGEGEGKRERAKKKQTPIFRHGSATTTYSEHLDRRMRSHGSRHFIRQVWVSSEYHRTVRSLLHCSVVAVVCGVILAPNYPPNDNDSASLIPSPKQNGRVGWKASTSERTRRCWALFRPCELGPKAPSPLPFLPHRRHPPSHSFVRTIFPPRLTPRGGSNR